MRDSATTPPYLIAPRYLAGPDPHAVTTAEEVLLAAGWQIDRHANHTDYRAPGSLRQSRYLPDQADHRCPGKPLMAWEFTAHPAPDARAAWTVWFARDTPPEITAAFAATLADDTPRPTPEDGPHYLLPPRTTREATSVLATAGWMRDIGRNDDTWYAPNEQAVVVTAAFPNTTGRGGANWLCAARRATDGAVLWLAVASPATPTHLMAALCRALTDPTPVPRHTLPGPDIGALVITRLP
ncbi:DUF317 domain-containing protein [Streptomyces sp. NEAU-YJ-81]|uniref:DUF317 domain-containing protein n=1 Tax=Streptomyces sp. NEAU-YJ-81 TaxID=2820288 RepID=UPI001ABCB4E0|nr:DUF317 domain-containing protein [Streptomyces sp. NEAU-YJ-81]MBO3681690.1 DUF317 domain-containing protein [Streptomyces sp. NEAU-YJ-81]